MWRSEVKKTLEHRKTTLLHIELRSIWLWSLWGEGGGRAAKKITIHEWVGYYFHVISAMQNCSIERTHETQPLKTRQIEHAQCKCLCLHSAQTYFRWKNCKMTDIGQVFFDIPSNYCTSTSVFIPLFFLISLKLTGDFASIIESPHQRTNESILEQIAAIRAMKAWAPTWARLWRPERQHFPR